MKGALVSVPAAALSKLQEQEKYLRLLLANSPNIVLLLDREGLIAYCTDSFLRLIAVNDLERIKGRTLREVYRRFGDETFADLGVRRFETVKNTHQTVSTHLHITFPALGERRPYTIQTTPMLDEDGSFFGALAMYHDTTDLRRAEADDRTQIMLDATPLAASFWDAAGNMLDCNMEAVRLFGLTNKSDYTDHFFELNPEYQPDGESTADKASRLIAKAFETGYQRFEWMYLTGNGEDLPVETTLVRVPWKNEYRLAAYSRDLREIRASEQKRQEAVQHGQEMEVQARAAMAASEAKSQFLSNMSHEIRTPMNAIIGMAELLLSETLSERQRVYVRDIKVSSTALLSIINDILDFSKIEAGKLQLAPVDYNIHEFLHNLHSMFTYAAQSKGIVFEMNLCGDLPLYLYGDDIRLRQALVNILGNAVKFTREGTVSLTVKTADHKLQFEVADTGIGMRQEDIPKIFNDFDQLDARINRNITGTGLGLSITKKLIEMMGGSIQAKSQYGKGTVFYIQVPLILGNEEKITNNQQEFASISAPDAKILVVDDNELNLNVASGMLRLCGITCDTALSGREAIKKIAENRYDIVFMDHMMPDLDGVETTRLLRERYDQEALVIVALTANAIEGVRETLLQAEMNDYLSKPIDRARLNQVLEKWLPPHKIQQRDTEAPNTVPKLQGTLAEAAKIEALHVQLGLGLMGGQEDVYETSLRILSRRLPDTIERLHLFLENADLKGFSIEVHGVKGSLNNIGASELAQQAEALEMHSKEKDDLYCQANLAPFTARLHALQSKLSALFQDAHRENAPRHTGTKEQLEASLLQIGELLDAFESDDALALLSDLLAYDFGNEQNANLAEVHRMIEEFEYDHATAKIKTLLNQQ